MSDHAAEMLAAAVSPVEAGLLVLEYVAGHDGAIVAPEAQLGDVAARGIGLDLFRTAGKTGSAEAGEDRHTGAAEAHAWFTGYAPRERPEVVVTVWVDHAGHGGEVAAPLARDILEAYARGGGAR